LYAGGADRPAGAFGKDDQLTATNPYFLAGLPHHLQKRATAGTAVDGDHAGLDQIPAKKRNPRQLTLENVKRLIEALQQREGFPHRLMLGGDEQRSFRDFLDAAIFHLHVAYDTQQPGVLARPKLGHRHDPRTRHQEGGNRNDQPAYQQQIEQHVVDQRAQKNGDHRQPNQFASVPVLTFV